MAFLELLIGSDQNFDNYNQLSTFDTGKPWLKLLSFVGKRNSGMDEK